LAKWPPGVEDERMNSDAPDGANTSGDSLRLRWRCVSRASAIFLASADSTPLLDRPFVYAWCLGLLAGLH